MLNRRFGYASLRTNHSIRHAASERSNMLSSRQLFDLSEAVHIGYSPTTGSAPIGHLTPRRNMVGRLRRPIFYFLQQHNEISTYRLNVERATKPHNRISTILNCGIPQHRQ